MKRAVLNVILILAVGLLGAAAFLWVGSRPPGEGAGGQAEGAQAPQRARFHCPMHPTYVKDTPGDCPICGMRLVPVEEEQEAVESAPPEPDPAEARFHCPMHPTYVKDTPGDCPICSMRLVPVEQEEPPAGGHAGHGAAPVSGYSTVNIPTRKQQSIGVRTEPVRRMALSQVVDAVGRVDYDETRLSTINAKVAGWIEALHVDRTGQAVRRGQPLLDIYSPELVATQEELLLARDNLARLEAAGARPGAVAQARGLVEDARRRLALWDIPQAAIQALEERGTLARRLTLDSPVGGYVVEKNALEGMAIAPGQNLFRVADLSRVWILAEVYESQATSLQRGQRAEVAISYLPGRSLDAKVDHIYPYLDPATRTVRVRLVVPNPDGALRPEMYARVRFHGAAGGEVVAVPNEAVLDTGERKIAFVSRGDGTFEPRELLTGVRTRDHTEVREGLIEGEMVVTSGNFLIDSESRLKAALAAMGSGSGTPGHAHGP